jgi:Kef-type K+ transport system membrane component KefB
MLQLALGAAVQPLSHEATLLFLAQLTLLLGVARILGEWMRRMDQPAVVGELLAGLLLGPSVLGLVAPTWFAEVFPREQQLEDLLSAFSLIGVLMLLIVTGLEIDLKLIIRRIRVAAAVSSGGLVVPFALGYGLGWALPDSYLAAPNQRLPFCLFMAVIMSISAIPVIAKVLMDLKAIRRDIGQITLAAAMIDDAIGWVLLSVAAGLAAKGSVTFSDAGYSLFTSAAVMILGLKFGRSLVNRFLNLVEHVASGDAPQLAAILFLALSCSIVTHGLGLESMLGAFLAGILVGQSPRLKAQVAHTLELFTSAFFAPIFFASAGLKVNLAALLSLELAGLTLLVLLIASIGKYLGCYLGGWAQGLRHWERLALGSGMNPRGAMGVIVARIGLSMGVLTGEMYSVLIAMAILTSLAAPPLLRWTLAKVELTPEEVQRLASDHRQTESFLEALRKVLLPCRGGHNIQWAAHLLGHLSHHHPVAITALFALREKGEPDAETVRAVGEQLQRSQGPAPRVVTVHNVPVTHAIVRECDKGGYDLLVIGASVGAAAEAPLLVDEVVQSTPCPTMIVRAKPGSNDQVTVTRVLLPAVGTNYSHRAAEVAAVICRSMQATLTIMHVVPELDPDTVGYRAHEMSLAFAQQLVDDHADSARALGANVDTLVAEHVSAEKAILEHAESGGYDLVFMGINMRPVGGRAFMGHRADRVMRSAPCAVVVLCSQ